MTSRVVEMSSKEVWRTVGKIHGYRKCAGKFSKSNSYTESAAHRSTNTTTKSSHNSSPEFPLSRRHLTCRESTAVASRLNVPVLESPRSKDAVVLCNHNLASLHGLNQSDSPLISSFCCGECSLLGTFDVRRAAPYRDCGSLSLVPPKPLNLSHTSCLGQYRPLLSTSASDSNWLVLRSFHSSVRTFKEESKAEKTVKALKDEAKVKADGQEVPPVSPTATSAAPTPESTTPDVSKSVAPAKKSIGQRIVDEVKHYYHGFRLLFIDIKVCIRTIWQLMNGKSLTRRERRQLVRTTSDLFRLVPFLVFVVVPFMEFLLPVALKLFPGMLPSTFAEENKEQEKIRKRLKVKLEMAKFLQDTIEETALTRKGAKGESVQDFVTFMNKIRTTGQETTNEEIMKYSKVFDEDITLEHLNYAQLQALMRLLELPVVGTSYFMRFRLRMKLRQLETDDRMISKEGVDNMTVWELQEACRTRGMRALGVPKEKLQHQLDQWLDLHLRENIPTSLLLLSRALYLPEELTKEEQLKATLSALPDTLDEEAKVKISEVTGDRVDPKTKLEMIKQEEEAIKQEALEESKKAEEEEKKALEEAKKQEEVLVDKAEVIDEPPEVIKAAAEPITPSIVDSSPEQLTTSPQEILTDKAEELVDDMTPISKSDLEEIEDVLEKVAEEKGENLEKDELDALKEDVSEYKEALEDLREVVLSSSGGTEELVETVSAKRLSKKVNRMVSQMDAIMQSLNNEKDMLMEDIEIQEVKIKRSTEENRQDILDTISEKRKNVVGINELLLAIRRIQKVPDDTKYQRIVQVLDEDQDGVIDINDALKVIELLGRENVSVEAKQMTELMDILRKEEVIEKEEKEEKLREKVEKQKQQEEETEATPGGGEQGLSAPSDEVAETSREKKEQQQ